MNESRSKNTVRQMRKKHRHKVHKMAQGPSVLPGVSSRTQTGRTKGFYIYDRFYYTSLFRSIALASYHHPDIKQFWVYNSTKSRLIGIFRRINLAEVI